MDTAGSKMNLNFSFRLQVFGIELDLVILLFSLCLNQERITEILVMQMKRRLVVPVSVGLDDLPVGDFGIFNKDVGIGDCLAIRPAHKSFDGEPMIGFMRGRACRWKGHAQAQGGEDNRESLPSLLSLPQTGTPS